MGIASGAFIPPSPQRAESPLAATHHAPACGPACTLANAAPSAAVLIVVGIVAVRYNKAMRRRPADPARPDA
jgi:hypothetical protein